MIRCEECDRRKWRASFLHFIQTRTIPLREWLRWFPFFCPRLENLTGFKSFADGMVHYAELERRQAARDLNRVIFGHVPREASPEKQLEWQWKTYATSIPFPKKGE